MAGVEQSWSKSFLSARLPFLGSLATKGIYILFCFLVWGGSTPVVFLLLASLDPSLAI